MRSSAAAAAARRPRTRTTPRALSGRATPCARQRGSDLMAAVSVAAEFGRLRRPRGPLLREVPALPRMRSPPRLGRGGRARPARLPRPRRRRRGAVPARPRAHPRARRSPRELRARRERGDVGRRPREPLDLVLCDVRMPGINGLELVRQIHDLDAGPALHRDHRLRQRRALGRGAARRAPSGTWRSPSSRRSLDVVRRLVEQAIEHGRLKAENRLLQQPAPLALPLREHRRARAPALRERARDRREGRRHRQHGARSPARAAPARS